MNKSRIIITGGPSTGKSSMIRNLADRGYPVMHEVARAEIKRQLEQKSKLVPWDDVLGFSRKVFEGQRDQYNAAQAGKRNFYDRGIPDLIAYLKNAGIKDEYLERQAASYRYHPRIFILPPWREIYESDTERREEWEEMLRIHNWLEQTYRGYGYELVKVPMIEVKKRVDFIFEHLSCDDLPNP